MTPSVALDVGRLRGVNAPLWRKRGKHAINGRTAERLKRQGLRGLKPSGRLASERAIYNPIRARSS